MEQSDRIRLSKARLARAQEFLSAAIDNIQNCHYLTAANRAYYAVYSAIRAVLVLEYSEMAKHSGNISEFRRHYIKTGVFRKEFSEYLRLLFIARNDSDYDPMYIISKEEVQVQVENAKEMVSKIAEFLENEYEKSEN